VLKTPPKPTCFARCDRSACHRDSPRLTAAHPQRVAVARLDMRDACKHGSSSTWSGRRMWSCTSRRWASMRHRGTWPIGSRRLRRWTAASSSATCRAGRWSDTAVVGSFGQSRRNLLPKPKPESRSRSMWRTRQIALTPDTLGGTADGNQAAQTPPTRTSSPRRLTPRPTGRGPPQTGAAGRPGLATPSHAPWVVSEPTRPACRSCIVAREGKSPRHARHDP
jgi:hypothetical protein